MTTLDNTLEQIVYSRPASFTDATTHYCPGCTHGVAHRLVAEVNDEMGLRERTIGVASVGCSAFSYNYFDVDKKLHPRKGEDGKERKYLINPYQMVATNGKYYLICNYDKYSDVVNFRLDRITGIKLLETPVKPMKEVRGLQNGLDLPKHMAEHIYMFSGDSIWVTFRARRDLVSDVIDWFGKDVRFSDITEDEVTVKVKVNEEAMKLWALQYSRYITVVSPIELVDEIRGNLQESLRRYSEEPSIL